MITDSSCSPLYGKSEMSIEIRIRQVGRKGRQRNRALHRALRSHVVIVVPRRLLDNDRPDPTIPLNRNRTVTVKALPENIDRRRRPESADPCLNPRQIRIDPDMPGTRSMGVGLLRVTLAAPAARSPAVAGSRNIGFTSHRLRCFHGRRRLQFLQILKLTIEIARHFDSDARFAGVTFGFGALLRNRHPRRSHVRHVQLLQHGVQIRAFRRPELRLRRFLTSAGFIGAMFHISEH